MELYKVYPLKIHNSLSKEKELFTPITSGNVGMYVCGPTVYSNVHLGNVRTFVSFDLIFRYLKHLGYKVRYVRNITDAGHLTDDDNIDNDRFVRQSRLEQLEPMEIVQKYTIDFHKVLQKMNNLSPTIEPTATGHIIEQIEITKDLLNKGLAYEVNGSVYFDVLQYNKKENYGVLSGRKVEEAIHNTRTLEGQSEKKNPQDFALWKKADDRHIMRWASPWSDGFPGWHLECTAMSTKYLGKTFDIHGGGMDLKFPHHECEIAQAKANNNVNPVNYWLHANMLTLNGQRMSKTTGNYILPEQIFTGNNKILRKAFSPSTVRFFMLQAHYRSVLDFSSDALEASEKGYNKLMEALKESQSIAPQKQSTIDVQQWIDKCYKAMSDDFNSPILISHLFEAVKYINLLKENKASLTEEDLKLFTVALNAFVFDVLGLEDELLNEDTSRTLNGVVEMLIQIRKDARENKDWALSDKIRDDLANLGVQLKDGKDGTTFSVQ